MNNNDINNYYNKYDEEGRLFKDKQHQIEWISTMYYLNKYLDKNSLILDSCAGTGNYAFQLAKLGHSVIAGDLVQHNVDIINEKQNKNPVLEDVYNGNVCDLSQFEKEKFDAILCLGAFYHLSVDDRLDAMTECLRTLKHKGIFAISYINAAAALIKNLYNKENTLNEAIKCYNEKTDGNLFMYMLPDEIEKYVRTYKVKILAHIGTDGIGYFFSDRINKSSKEEFEKLIQFHLCTCHDRSLLGYSLHGLLILQKK